MKKFCLIIPYLQAGGMERVMSELANYFASEFLNAEIHLVIYGKNHEIFYTLHKNIIVHKPLFYFDYTRTG